MIDFTTFEGLDLRVGTVVKAEDFLEANKPAYQLVIDFGPLGTLNSSAQITKRYLKDELSREADHCSSEYWVKENCTF